MEARSYGAFLLILPLVFARSSLSYGVSRRHVYDGFLQNSLSWPVSVAATDELQCPPCNKVKCSELHEAKLNCKGGMVLGGSRGIFRIIIHYQTPSRILQLLPRVRQSARRTLRWVIQRHRHVRPRAGMRAQSDRDHLRHQ